VGNIAVRSGQHCVHSWFVGKEITGSIRASIYFYNTNEEVSHFISTVEQVLLVI
jgi:cysteine desulfurase/selenocysteine lyase